MNNNQVSKILNDPVYGFITLKRGILLDIVEHPYFQRLSRIKQLGLTYLVYPGAHHTRFHHALGCVHLMNQAILTLREMGYSINENEQEGVKLAILLHDIGHGPFSHALEHSIVSEIQHEELSHIFMQQLNIEFGGQLDTAIAIFKDEYPKRFLHQLVSSQLDMDRLDYLKRDSFFTGVSEGVVSNQRIIKMFDLVNDEIVVKEKGVYSIEKFLIARRLMYWQVYLHKTVLSAEFLLMNILKRAKYLCSNGECIFTTEAIKPFLNEKVDRNKIETSSFLNSFARLDDYDVFSCIKQWVNDKDPVLSMLCDGIVNRKLPKVLISKEKFPDEEVHNHLLIHQKKLGFSNDEMKYFVFQRSMTNNAYDTKKDEIKILYKDGTIKDITAASDNLNVQALSKQVRKHFLFAPYF
jgi:HD superfamily phosphohydrolase